MRAYRHDQARVRQRLLARDLTIELAQRRGARGARGRERLESESRHDAGRAAIPDVGNHEDAGSLVQRPKAHRLVALARHGPHSSKSAGRRAGAKVHSGTIPYTEASPGDPPHRSRSRSRPRCGRGAARRREHPVHRGVAISTLTASRSEEHTSELQSRLHLVCRLLLEKKKNTSPVTTITSTHAS